MLPRRCHAAAAPRTTEPAVAAAALGGSSRPSASDARGPGRRGRRSRPAGETGEVCARARRTSDDDASTGTSPSHRRRSSRDGWYHTGDAGYLDDEGYLFLVDRVKDMIVTGGENVYSIEVERAISSHPAVRQVAVVGVPHAKWGEAVHAVVVCERSRAGSNRRPLRCERSALPAELRRDGRHARGMAIEVNRILVPLDFSPRAPTRSILSLGRATWPRSTAARSMLLHVVPPAGRVPAARGRLPAERTSGPEREEPRPKARSSKSYAERAGASTGVPVEQATCARVTRPR